MKKQNSYDKLAFNKAVVAELDTQTLANVNGGTGTSYLTVVGPTSAFTSATIDMSQAIN
ncbi:MULTISPECIES: class I lanthipeptide [unclassified Flavobacterium]|uniref:class I lanthipeptide n=1 Tax=unclassified Flavobacterium TaxID=196869 RepID=UPI003624468E